MSIFDKFLNKYALGIELQTPTSQTVEKFQNTLPKELLGFWQEYGFGDYGNGLLKVINPEDYKDILYTWLGEENPNKVPILMTAFGNLFYYRKLSETDDDVCMLDIHYRQIINCGNSFNEFFEEFIVNDGIEEKLLNKKLFENAVKEKGILDEDEIFLFAPALAWGGSETVECIQKGNAVIHQQLLFEMGADHFESNEEGDAWSNAYEANPQVFERDDGAVMVNFTLTETTDTILPTAPENLYAVEGEEISLWALTFFSLTKDKMLDVLEYHEALERLQPYVVETRGDRIMLRGLSLEEMENVLSEE